MSRTPQRTISAVVCPVCSQTTDIYRHVSTEYDKTNVFHRVLCQSCGSTLKVITVVNGHFLEAKDLRATIVHANTLDTTRADRPRTPHDRR